MTQTENMTASALASLSENEIQTLINDNNITFDKSIKSFLKWLKSDKKSKNKFNVKLLKDLSTINIIEMKTKQNKKMKSETQTEQPAPPKEEEEIINSEPVEETEEEKEIREMEEMIRKIKEKKKAKEKELFLKKNPPPKPAKEQLKDILNKYEISEEDTIKINELLEKLKEPQGKKCGVEKDPERNIKHKNRDKSKEFLCPYCKFKRMNIKSMNAHCQSDKCKRQINGKEEDKEQIIKDMNNYDNKKPLSDTNYMNFLFKTGNDYQAE